MKAYELIAELDRLFGPVYRASPGGVYPALTALVEERLMTATADGRGKRYDLTARGRTALDQRRRQLAALEARVGVDVRGINELQAHLEQFEARVMNVSGRVDVAAAAKVLDAAAEEIEQLGGRYEE